MATIEKNHILVAENTIKDDRGRISIISVFDIIYATEVPTTQSPMYVIASFSVKNASKSTIDMLFRIVGPKGKVAAESALKTELKKSEKIPTVNYVINCSNILLETFGRYKFEFLYKSEVVGSKIVVVEQKDIDQINRVLGVS